MDTIDMFVILLIFLIILIGFSLVFVLINVPVLEKECESLCKSNDNDHLVDYEFSNIRGLISIEGICKCYYSNGIKSFKIERR